MEAIANDPSDGRGRRFGEWDTTRGLHKICFLRQSILFARLLKPTDAYQSMMTNVLLYSE